MVKVIVTSLLYSYIYIQNMKALALNINTILSMTIVYYQNIDLFDIEVNIQGHNLIFIQDTLTWGICT